MKQSEQDIKKMYLMKSMDTEVLLRWCKLLEYDFFRIYTQHLILYAPPASAQNNKSQGKRNSAIPQFRKNIYTKEIIDFILEMVYTGEKTKLQIIHEYGIPKSTLNKWIIKFSS
ncbi:hypothetical protein [Chryseobacterium sp. HR92]|uniref:hypothetical protein n=1 Tax=Chryseobacterium sp. HR92 TaxID=3094839 RepID=UPI0038908549|nr:hypothetical protein SFA27_08035 [Chryseobacterium sp. HR92]